MQRTNTRGREADHVMASLGRSKKPLVCFFLLYQHQSHFSLLEINEKEDLIYHYDSIGEAENVDVKVHIKCPV